MLLDDALFSFLRFHFQVSRALGSANHHCIARLRTDDFEVGALVSVVRQQVATDLHGTPVCVTSQNAETPQRPSRGGLVTGEDAIAGQKEVQPWRFR